MSDFSFEATVIHWRGPSPYFYAPLPEAHVEAIRDVAKRVTYGWGMIPVSCRIGEVEFTTSLFPKDDTYLLPLKDIVRRRCGVTAGDLVQVEMTITPARPA